MYMILTSVYKDFDFISLFLQEHYHFLYKAMDSICEDSMAAGDRDSGIANCSNYPATLPGPCANNVVKHAPKQEATTTM